MSRNNNYQQIQQFVSSIPSIRKDIVCNDCGGISATKIQQLLSTLECTTQLINTKNKIIRKKKINKKTSLQRKRIPKLTKKRKLNIKKIRSSRNNNNKKVQSKTKKKIK